MDNELLMLDAAERTICWRNTQGQVRRHVFRRIGVDHWNGYFSRIAMESDRTSRMIDTSSAALWLYREAAVRADGFSVRGGGSLTELPNWQERIPMGQRIQAVEMLSAAERSCEVEETMIEPDCELVRLDATWNEDAGAAGSMRRFMGLVHRFTPPTAAHQQRFSRELSRSLLVGGSRDAKTVYPVKQKVLVKLYDELIQTVEGYGVKGGPLSGREEIVKEMDLFHKVAAVGELFTLLGEATSEEAAGE